MIPASYLSTLIDNRYRLRRVVGEGASSWVFAATDLRLEREVALKLFKPPGSEDDVKRRRRCVSEGRTLAKFVHPHIVSIFDASEDGAGHAYLVMELCEAGTLEAELTQCERLTALDTLQLVLPLMGALAFAHDRNIVHRDLKPGNIVLVEEAGQRRAKLLDFGISIGTGVRLSSDLALGTPSYMAPEQARGEPASAATDVWALGVVFYRCLAGVLPFDANTPSGVLIKIVQERAAGFASACGPSLGAHLALALDRALEPNQTRRYRDIRSFARAIAGACALDGLAINLHPEPLGLPQFASWFANAKGAETTRSLPPPVETGLVPPMREPARRDHDARKPSVLARVAVASLIAAIAGLIGGSALSMTDKSPQAGTKTTQTPPKAQQTPSAPASARLRAPTRLPEDSPNSPPAVLAKPSSEAPPTPSSKRRKKSEAPAMATSTPPRAFRVIKNWNW